MSENVYYGRITGLYPATTTQVTIDAQFTLVVALTFMLSLNL